MNMETLIQDNYANSSNINIKCSTKNKYINELLEVNKGQEKDSQRNSNFPFGNNQEFGGENFPKDEVSFYEEISEIITKTINDSELHRNSNLSNDCELDQNFNKKESVTGGNIKITQTANSLTSYKKNSLCTKSINLNQDNFLAQLFKRNNISFFTPNKEKIEDCYTMIRKLGNGAFGKCNLAQLKKGNKDIRYAIKTIELNSIDKDKLILLKTEISCLKKLIHPNIVHFFQLFYDEKNIHMVMEPCMNGSLFDKILEKGTFTEKHAIKVMISLLSSLNYCHNNNIIHRDIKPENILLVNSTGTNTQSKTPNQDNTEYEYDLRLIDFGLSHIYSNKDLNSLLSSSVGSPYFMAPEVLNECYNSKCDVWSLGILFYFLIAGVPPFYSDSIPELFKLILNYQPNFQSRAWNNISKETIQAINFMLVKDFNKRPSCQELLGLPCFTKELEKLHNDEKLYKNHNESLMNCIYVYFQNRNSFIKEIASVISNQLLTSEFKRATYLFKVLDKDNNGCASINSLLKFFKDKQIDQEVLKKFPYIYYSDIIESITYGKMFNNDFCKVAFETLDVDQDKFISSNDFSTSIFKNASKITQIEIDKKLEQVGLDKNFKIDYKTFRKIIIPK